MFVFVTQSRVALTPFHLVPRLTLSEPNYIPSVIRVTLVTSKVFTHNCATG
jgi:hypothetical protein